MNSIPPIPLFLESIIASSKRPIDLGCGPNKVKEAFGVDRHANAGVDRVMGLNVYPWPLESNAYDMIYA
jgi:hypothetical protein